jgi:hypothetical protein
MTDTTVLHRRLQLQSLRHRRMAELEGIDKAIAAAPDEASGHIHSLQALKYRREAEIEGIDRALAELPETS